MRRLGKQRVEVLQILQCLAGIKTGWKNHPAIKMWEGHTGALICYGRAMCHEWTSRGYKDTCLEKIDNLGLPFGDMPKWNGNKEFHDSHKSNLIRKFPEHYKKFWPDIPDNLPYVWPKNLLDN
jgi:hypothetical protein